MDLHSADGTSVRLQPVGYQFPDAVSRAHADYDANWLIIEGEVVLADGRAWAFTDPALLTWEAGELGEWLAGAAQGQVEVVAPEQAAVLPDDDESPDAAAIFVEPNLAFSVAGYTEETISLRVHMAYESAPDWAEDIIVDLTCPRESVLRAAQEWNAQSAVFPRRS
ncbi:hypothetical protein LWF15_08435 [Kineosporia rhizophila]|uniref:WapI family immunity protein n=1 Tax=Kineosporia rhizophila TaxID=84633 RepID=UPI000ABB746D|nr:hypothetical protein [Kineosporia rhizophila]MCE0535535.1 hypothetical protein [Kineosporia rhizophila]